MFRTCSFIALAVLAQIMTSPAGLAQDAADQKIEDATRLKLAEQHIDSIEDAMKRIAGLPREQTPVLGKIINLTIEKRREAEALSRILTGYFLAKRLPPIDSAKGFESYIKQVLLLQEMIVLATKCYDENDVEFCSRLRSRAKELRQRYLGESDEATAPPADEAAGADVALDLDDMEGQVFESCNIHRKGRGLSPLELDAKLCAAAREHSEEMYQKGYFDHRSPTPGKARFTDRAETQGTTASAENIARQCVDAEMAMQLWLKSSEHRRNIEGPSYSRAGIGRSEGYYTLVFGK